MMVVVYTRSAPQLKAALDVCSHALGTTQPRLSHRENDSSEQNDRRCSNRSLSCAVALKLCVGSHKPHSAKNLHDASSTFDSVHAAKPIRQATKNEQPKKAQPITAPTRWLS
jgi:hypothetical protein